MSRAIARRFIASSIVALAALAGSFAAEPASAPPAEPDATYAKVEGGTVRGKIDGDVIAWKGIPFAAPPTGRWRWRAPQPVSAWYGVREAFEFGADPLQPGAPSPRSTGKSEDCLFLNVWRPTAASDTPLPVLVWIYGGGLVRGGASLYPGEALARQGIVVVTFNYRVGRLGFFAHPALAREAPKDLRGNYGYMDQLAALNWVKTNIAAFGGDPKNVTIAGESAGGGSVLVMLTSPLARGLFHRAIVQSAGIPSARAAATALSSLAEAESVAVEYARSVGIAGDDGTALNSLRVLPDEMLSQGLDDYILALVGGPRVAGMSSAIVDGKLVVEAPEVALRAGAQAMVPVMVGANDADLAASPARTKDAIFTLFGGLAPQARKLYDPSGSASLDELVAKVMSDQAMVEPSRHLADLMTRAGQPAYFYRFSYVAESQRATVRGAEHGAEIVFAFDQVPAFFQDKATPADLEMARTTSGYWASFVKSGDPNGGGRTNWPRYDPATRDVLNFTNQGVAHGADPLKDRLDLWDSVWERGGHEPPAAAKPAPKPAAPKPAAPKPPAPKPSGTTTPAAPKPAGSGK